jgi:hypothetical protein
MANNIFEQFDEAYSRWSILDTVGKEMQLDSMWQQLCATYNNIILVWQSRGYLTVDEYKYKNQIYDLLIGLNNQKMIVDKQLSDEMMKHLVKMIVKQK